MIYKYLHHFLIIYFAQITHFELILYNFQVKSPHHAIGLIGRPYSALKTLYIFVTLCGSLTPSKLGLQWSIQEMLCLDKDTYHLTGLAGCPSYLEYIP